METRPSLESESQMDMADFSWWHQLIPYLTAVLVMKIVVLLPLTLPGISTVLLRFAHATIEYLSPSLQVIFVMMVFPLILNTLQFLLVDQVIKAGKADVVADGYERVDEEAILPKPTPQNSVPSSPLLAAADSVGYGTQPSPLGFASASRLSEDWQREARNLSPKARTSSRLSEERLPLSDI